MVHPSDEMLRTENERLRERVAELEGQLQRLRKFVIWLVIGCLTSLTCGELHCGSLHCLKNCCPLSLGTTQRIRRRTIPPLVTWSRS